MAKPATPIAVASDFPGLIVNTDPRDIPPGAAEVQENLQSHVTGELRTRGGIKEVRFEAD